VANEIPFTQNEFFLLDERRGNLEYWAGRIAQLENNTSNHGRIIMNLGAALSRQLPARCGLMTNVGVRAGRRVHFLKPDLMVVCGDEERFAGRSDILVNPKVIFEVLSASTQAYDKREKLQQYRCIQSLEEYVLLSQTEPKVLVYRRQDGQFGFPEEVTGKTRTLTLHAVKSSVKLDRIYRGTGL